MNTTATVVHTFLISAIGLSTGDVLHRNGREWVIACTDLSGPGGLMRAYYLRGGGDIDWIVLVQDEMVVVS